MPRIRTIKPDFTSDAKVARLTRDARLTFVLLWTEADDAGRLVAAPKRLVGALYPHDSDVTPAKLTRWLGELDREGMIVRYRRDGVEYLWVRNFDKHQKISHPTDSRLPEPPDRSDTGFAPTPLRRKSRSVPEPLRPDLGSGSGKGNGSGGGSSSSSETEEPRGDEPDGEEEDTPEIPNWALLEALRRLQSRSPNHPTVVDTKAWLRKVADEAHAEHAELVAQWRHDQPDLTDEQVAERLQRAAEPAKVTTLERLRALDREGA